MHIDSLFVRPVEKLPLSIRINAMMLGYRGGNDAFHYSPGCTVLMLKGADLAANEWGNRAYWGLNLYEIYRHVDKIEGLIGKVTQYHQESSDCGDVSRVRVSFFVDRNSWKESSVTSISLPAKYCMVISDYFYRQQVDQLRNRYINYMESLDLDEALN